MANLSKIKRERMLGFLETLKMQHTDDESIRAFTEIENHLRDKKYGLVWEEHTEHVDKMLEDNIPVLCENKELEIVSDESLPYNFILEGDNLQSLYLLEKTHKGMIDVIYIDPPYNRGKNDFVYDDNMIDEEDVYRHSKWLSFMKVRLKIAQRLLSNGGAIFISIDDNEYANLKLLCDEVFDHHNFIATYFWKKTDTPPSLSNKVRKKYEYILCYGKDIKSKHKFSQGLIDGGDAPLLNSGNLYKSITFPEGSVHFNIADGIYKHNPSYKIHILDNVIVKDGLNYNEFSAEGEWKWSQDTLCKEVQNGTYFIVKSKAFSIRYQRTNIESVKIPQNNLNSEIGVGTNEEAEKEIREIFNEKGIFDYPKPVSLVKFLIKMVNKGNSINILDFFAGSGTTGQAVAELNSEDGGTRKFILCTDNSKDINATGNYLATKGIVETQPPKTKKKEYEQWCKKVIDFCECSDLSSVVDKSYEKFGISQRITQPRIKTIIIGKRTDGSVFSEGIKANLKYFVCEWTPRRPEDDLLSNALCYHIKEMIELQNSIEIDNVKNVLILNKNDFKNTILNLDVYDQIEKIWVNQNIIFNSEELKLLNPKGYKYIPKEFFGQELREVAE